MRRIKKILCGISLAAALGGMTFTGDAVNGPLAALPAETVYAAPGEGTDAQDLQAEEIGINIVPANNESAARLRDGSYSTAITFTEDNPLTITPADEEEKIYGLYVIWAAVPGEWELVCGDNTITCGKNGFLHEFVEIPGGSAEAVIKLAQNERICDIKAFGKGAPPSDVQVWEPVCDKADILLLSTHADDEILFFGGILPEYAGERELAVQLVYFSNYFGGTVVREHEKLDGLWTAGVRNYPVNGDFPDVYADDLEAAKRLYGYDETLDFVVSQIRRFKPQVCVAQDTDGEYGHGTHMLTSAAMQEAVTVSMDADAFPESAEQYGVWDVPKTYIHLYKENEINLDCRKPLSRFGGSTALEVATESYKKHVSQQWCWFYVSDTYEYSIARFGLCRSTVGADTGNDMMENLVSYEQQRKLEEEKRAAEEALRAYEQASREQASREQASREKAEYEHQYGVPKGEASPGKAINFIKNIVITILFMALAAALLLLARSLMRSFAKKRKDKRPRHRNDGRHNKKY